MKDIKGFEGKYAITRDGKVWSYKSNKYLSTYEARGYIYVNLFKEGKQHKHLIHRLVAEAFIPNPDNKEEVNHIDENKYNNCVDNLEWVNRNENLNYGTRNKRIGKALCKPVYCVELNKVFESGQAAAEALGISKGNISKVCNGKRESTNGYHFRFVSLEEADQLGDCLKS